MTSLKNILVGIVCGIVWYYFCPDKQGTFAGKPTTKVNIKRTALLIKKYQKAYGHIPLNLGQLRLIPGKVSRNFVPYDGFATRFSYLPVSDKFYILRSHGSGHPIPLTLSTLPAMDRSVLTQGNITPLSRPYPAALLEGSRAKSSVYAARLFRFGRNDRQTLVVQHLSQRRKIYVCPHPGVEEYYWVRPTQLVFTATGDDRYDDGIYSWDFESGQLVNLLREKSSFFAMTKGPQPRYLLALAGRIHHQISAFIYTRRNESVSASDFFDHQNLFVLSFGDQGQLIKMTPYATAMPPQPIWAQSLFKGLKLPDKFKNQTIVSWLTLPLAGPTEQVLNQWQAFALNHPDSPLFPYALIWLSVLYNDANMLYQSNQPEIAAGLRKYGTDMTQLLANLPAIPGYIEAIARHNQGRLRAGKTIGISLGKLN